MPRNFSVVFSLIAAIILSIVGVALIYSATHRGSGYMMALRQTIWILLGIIGAVMINYISRRQLYLSAPWLYLGGIFLLVITLFFGVTVRGETSWLELGLFRVQSSEISKLFSIILLSAVSTNYSRGELSRLKTGALAALILILPAVIVFLQGDVGMALIYICFFIGWLFILGFRSEGLFFILGGSAFTTGLLGMIILPDIFSVIIDFMADLNNFWILFFWGITALAFLYFGVIRYWLDEKVTPVAMGVIILVGLVLGGCIYTYLPSHQRQRLEAFVDPAHSPLGSGYHVIQARIAVGSGGLLGQGYLEGTQSQLGFIPELWTDFIYTVAIEELGSIVGILILILYVLLVYGTFSAAISSENWFDFYICAGIAFHWMIHSVVNLGFSLELLPVIGLPLPFVSYGGSFMVTNCLALGLAISLSDRPRGLGEINTAFHYW